MSIGLKQTRYFVAIQQGQVKLKNDRREINPTKHHIWIFRIISLAFFPRYGRLQNIGKLENGGCQHFLHFSCFQSASFQEALKGSVVW